MTNTSYAKLIDGGIQYLILPIRLTEEITTGGVTHPAGAWLYTDDEAAILALGYKPVVRTEAPVKAGWYYAEKWAETGTAIVQEWEAHEETGSPVTWAALAAAYKEGVDNA